MTLLLYLQNTSVWSTYTLEEYFCTKIQLNIARWQMEMNSMVMWYVGVLERYGEINRLLVSFRLPPDEIDHVFTQKT